MAALEHGGAGGTVQGDDAPSFEASLHEFLTGVAHLLNGKSEAKGYSKDGNGRPLFDSVYQDAGYGHAYGEIRYKLKRFMAMKNEEDLRKAAAWAFLMWDHARRHGTSG